MVAKYLQFVHAYLKAKNRDPEGPRLVMVKNVFGAEYIFPAVTGISRDIRAVVVSSIQKACTALAVRVAVVYAGAEGMY